MPIDRYIFICMTISVFEFFTETLCEIKYSVSSFLNIHLDVMMLRKFEEGDVHTDNGIL